jgi:hypothetical protein
MLLFYLYRIARLFMSSKLSSLPLLFGLVVDIASFATIVCSCRRHCLLCHYLTCMLIVAFVTFFATNHIVVIFNLVWCSSTSFFGA